MEQFLDLPPRETKPRERGLTHVIDSGLSIAQINGLVETIGSAIDFVKLGWGTSMVTANLSEKINCYQQHGVPVMMGGTLTELAIAQGKLPELVRWLKTFSIEYIEVSDGTLKLDTDNKLALIEQLAKEFTVLSEVGSKNVDEVIAPYRWVKQIQSELAAGAWKVITESRETGNAGIYRTDGEVRMGLIDEIVHRIDHQQLLFEAPRKEQQVWFLHRFGPAVNLGNIAPADVLSLETLRLGLRSDTLVEFGLKEYVTS
jgi:phosphosulfolactate synthase